MSQLSDVIYVSNEEKYSTLNFGTHLKCDWDENTFETINKELYTEYYPRYRVEEFIRHNAPELEEKLKDYLDTL